MTLIDQPKLFENLELIKRHVIDLQVAIEQILSKTPNHQNLRQLLYEIEQNFDTSVGSASLSKATINSPQLQIAAKLKTLQESNKLDILTALSLINFEDVSFDDQNINFILNYPENDFDDTFFDSSYDDLTSEPPTKTWPPALPAIEDSQLRALVFIHSTAISPCEYLNLQSTKQKNCLDNEKLVKKGDCFLQHALEEILDTSFPTLSSGELSSLRMKLSNNEMLTKFTLTYKLQEMLKHEIPKDCKFESKLKILSDLFLAYLGGLSKQDSYQKVKAWLTKVYNPIVQEFCKTIDLPQPLDQAAKAELAFLFQSQGKAALNYLQLDSDPYVVKCSFENETLGIGTSSRSVEHAQVLAAKNSLIDRAKIQSILVNLKQHDDTDLSPSKSASELVSSFSHTENATSPSTAFPNEPTAHQGGFQAFDPNAIPQFNPDQSTKIAMPHSYSFEKNPNFPSSVPLPGWNHSLNSSNPTNTTNYLNSSSKQESGAFPYPYMPGSSSGTNSPVSNYSGLPTSLPLNPAFFTNNPSGGNNPPSSVEHPSHATKELIDHSAKNNLYALLGSHHLNPVYKFDKRDMEFHATVMVKDFKLGEGWDYNKKLASQRAAMLALRNISGLVKLGVNPS